ncbi:peptidoglycan-binding protein [Algoriphagus namhaensis]
MNTIELTKFIQTWLKDKGWYTGGIDGDFGPKTRAAIAHIPEIPEGWSDRRKLVGTVQHITRQYGEDPGKLDGYYGPDTHTAYNRVVYRIENGSPPPIWRPEEIVQATKWPKSYTPEFDAFYGPKATGMVRMQVPYPLRIAWNPNQLIQSFSIHHKVKDSAERVFAEVLRHYGLDRIKELRLDYFGGCFNDRPIRGGTKPSMHSWAIALDFDPKNNDLHWGRDRASFARPEYEAWWQIWESEGWTSFGRQRNFDWMHVQAADI